MTGQKKFSNNIHFPQLDGLRGIAILMVMCFHYFPHLPLCNFGWTGVDLFFVLSGFLITSRLLPYIDDSKLLLKFYRNRFLRIVPLYFGFLIVFFTGWFLLSSKATLHSFKFYEDHWWQFFLFIQNWTFIFEYVTITTHLSHLWSICVEEQFYLVFPLFITMIKEKRKLLNLGLVLILLVLLTRLIYYYYFFQDSEYQKIYWNTFFRMDSLLIGFILYMLIGKKSSILENKKYFKVFISAIIIILLAGIIISKTPVKNSMFMNTIGFTIIAIFYAGIIWIALSNNNKTMNLILTSGILRYTGKISYGLYVFHIPIFLIGFSLLNSLFIHLNYIPDKQTIHLINVLICIPATYIVSHLSFKYYESYFLKHKAKMILKK